jgi:hypothetical protein
VRVGGLRERSFCGERDKRFDMRRRGEKVLVDCVGEEFEVTGYGAGLARTMSR